MDCGTADKLANAWLDGPIWHTLQQVEKYTDQPRYIVSIKTKGKKQVTRHKPGTTTEWGVSTLLLACGSSTYNTTSWVDL